MSNLVFDTYNQEVIASTKASYPRDTPFANINVLRFRAETAYEATFSGDTSTAGGMEAYMTRYVPAFAKIAKVQAEKAGRPEPSVKFLGRELRMLVGPKDEADYWHIFALVEYPSIESFVEVISSEEYQRDAFPHWHAAVEDKRMVACSPMAMARPQG